MKWQIVFVNWKPLSAPNIVGSQSPCLEREAEVRVDGLKKEWLLLPVLDYRFSAARGGEVQNEG